MGDKITIFDGEKSIFHTFNKSASFIFGKLKQGINKEEISKLLAKKYSIKESIAEKDVKEFIRELMQKKILE